MAGVIANRKQLGDLQHKLGRCHLMLGHNEDCIQWTERALSYRHESRDRIGEANSLNNLGLAHAGLRHSNALSFYNQALAIYQEQRDRPHERTTLTNLGNLCLSLSQLQEAFSYYEQALASFRQDPEKKDPSEEAAILANLGHACQGLARYDQAVSFYNQALSIYGNGADRKIEGKILNNLGTVYLILCQYDRAITFYKQALAIERQTGDKVAEGATLGNVGSVYQCQGLFKQALQSFEQALEIERQVKDREREGASLANIGNVYLSLNLPHESIAYYQQALLIQRETKQRSGEGKTLSNLGSAHLKLGRFEQAQAFFEQALSVHLEAQDQIGEGQTASNLMSLYSKLNSASFQQSNPKLAIFYGKQAVRVHQSIRKNIKSLGSEIQANFLQDRSNDYRLLADLLIDQGRLPEAQQVLGFLKEDELGEYTRSAPKVSDGLAKTADEQEFERRYQEVSTKLVAVSLEREALMKQPDRDKVMNRLLMLEKDLQIARVGFEAFLKQMAAELAKVPDRGDQIADLRNTRSIQEDLRALGSGVVLVYTIVGQDKFREILVTADVRKSYEVKVSQADVNHKVLEFRRALQNPSQDPRPAGKTLYDVVVSPSLRADLEQLKAKTVMWSLDGTLRYAPINALWDGQHYLVESFNNPIFTTGTQASLLRAPSPSWTVAALGVSKAWQGFPPLPGVRRELEAIVQTAQNQSGALPGKVELDQDFTEDSIPRAVLKRNPVLHIASHFNFTPGDYTQSFLLLGDGKKLSVAKLTGLDFEGVDLLTLSACDTANGSGGQGKEIESFAMLAQRANARAVVATLWPVADTSTPLLMSEFYKKRNAGMSKIEALQTAQRGLLEGQLSATDATSETRSTSRAVTSNSQTPFVAPAGKPYAHPFYWAPFILIGNWK